ncbi:MAG: hypothetical protein HY796_02660 [Elusimicrobia bacterium]|nr:hypothetical protein [Elusimicrobiota bacterium]
MNRNEDKKRDEGGPVIGRLGASFKKTSPFGKSPLFSKAAGNIMERIKSLSKKDLAFVVVGLSVLITAPVAEYLMSKPSSDNQLTSGFGQRGGDSSLYEPGINSLSQGSPDGSGEVITPLSARDPASLIIGSQSAAPVVVPPPSSGFRDAMKDAGRSAFSEVSKSAGAPTPIPRMQSGLRAMGSFFGGGESSRTSGGVDGKILSDAKNASGKSAKQTMVKPVATTGYKGVAYLPNSASRGAFEKLRQQAGKAAGNFSGSGAAGALDRAAADSPSAIGGEGGMGGGSGDATKAPPVSSARNESRFQPPESLENLAAKFRLQKQLEWEEYLKHGIAKDLIGAMVGALGGSLGKFVGGTADKILGNTSGAETYYCVDKIDKTKDCAKGNVKIKFASNDPKTIDSWGNPNRDTCPCSAWSKSGYEATFGAGGGGGPAPTPSPSPSPSPSPTPDPANPGLPVPVKESFTGYDEVLKQMLMARTDGAKTTDPVVLLDNTMQMAGGFTNLKANGIAAGIRNSGQKALTDPDSGISVYKRSISDTEMQVASVKSDYNIFKTRFGNVVKAAKAGTLVLGSSAQGVPAPSIGEEVMPYLNAAEESFKLYEKNSLAKAEERMKFNKKALGIYSEQVGFASGVADKVKEEYTGKDGVLKAAEGIYKELKEIKDSLGTGVAPDAEQQTTIVKHFKAIAGMDPAVQPPALPADAPVVTVSRGALDAYALAFNTRNAADYRDQAAAQPAGLIYRPIAWRGLDQNEPFLKKGEANDAAAIKEEQAAWLTVTPLKKATINELLDKYDNVPPNLLAASLRNVSEIPADAKNNAIDPTAAATLLTPLKTKMEEVRKRLAGPLPDGWGINLDNPTGAQPSPSPSPSPTPTPTPSPSPNSGTSINIINQNTNTIPGQPPAVPAGQASAESVALAKTTAADDLKIMETSLQGTDSLYKAAPVSKCTSAACKTNLAIANDARDSIRMNITQVKDLQTQLQKPGISQAEVDRINKRLEVLRIESARHQVRFDKSIAKVGELAVKKPVTPAPTPTPTPQPQPKPKNTPPHAIDQVSLVKGRTTINAYDGKGLPLKVDRCVQWGVGFTSGFTGQPVCKKYVKTQVTVEVNDYYLSYGKGEQLPLNAKVEWTAGSSQVVLTSGGLAYYIDPSVKRMEYDMEVKVACKKGTGSWVIEQANMRKGTASSANQLGGKVSAGWDLGPKVVAEINYAHTWNNYNHGEMLQYDTLRGKPCK